MFHVSNRVRENQKPTVIWRNFREFRANFEIVPEIRLHFEMGQRFGTHDSSAGIEFAADYPDLRDLAGNQDEL
jgi:hypothetical protein